MECPWTEEVRACFTRPSAVDDPRDEELRRHLEGCAVCQRDLQDFEDDAEEVVGKLNDESTVIPPTGIGHSTRAAVAGKSIGQFELIEQVGAGTFGSVWKASDTSLDRTFAVKIPRKGELNARETEQFLREARAAAQLKHPNIVSVHEVVKTDESVYIVSDFVHGVTLSNWLTGQSLTPREAAGLCRKIADALEHTHAAGVVHRDLKPGNIMMTADGEPLIMDFGLAKRETGEVTMTTDGQVLGTPAYMSPEQARGEAHSADKRSDIYSLGVVLFELLTKKRPFSGNPRMILHQVLNEEATSPRKLNTHVPRDLETICRKCLKKEPKRRYKTAAALAAELQRFIAGEPIEARPVSEIERFIRWCRRKPLVAGLWITSLTLLLVIPAAFMLFSQNRDLESSRETAVEDKNLAEEGKKNAEVETSKQTKRADKEAAAKRQQQIETITALLDNAKGKRVIGEYREAHEILRQLNPLVQKLDHKSTGELSVIAKWHFERGRVHDLLGFNKTALTAYTEAQRAYVSLDDAFGVAQAQVYLARHASNQGRLDDAASTINSARLRISTFTGSSPRHDYVRALVDEAEASMLRDRGEYAKELVLRRKAEQYLTTWVKSPVLNTTSTLLFQRSLGVVNHNMGTCLFKMKRYKESLTPYLAALRIRDRLSKAKPYHVLFTGDIFHSHVEIAKTYQELGDLATALKHARQARGALNQFPKGASESRQFKSKLAFVELVIGHITHRQEDWDSGLEHRKAARRIYKGLVKQFPKIQEYKLALGVTTNQVAWSLASIAAKKRDRDLLEEAIKTNREGVEILQGIAKSAPKNADYEKALNNGLRDRARMQAALRKLLARK